MNDKIMICIMEYIHIYIFVYKPTAKNQNEYQRYMLYIYISIYHRHFICIQTIILCHMNFFP